MCLLRNKQLKTINYEGLNNQLNAVIFFYNNIYFIDFSLNEYDRHVTIHANRANHDSLSSLLERENSL